MDNITQGFSNLTTTMSAGAKRFDEPVGDVGVPTDFAGNKLDPTGFAIDNFLRGIFSWVPGVLPVAKGTVMNPVEMGVTTEALPSLPGAKPGRGRRPSQFRRAAQATRTGLLDDPRIEAMQDKTKLGQS
jgi:hypothetical protein